MNLFPYILKAKGYNLSQATRLLREIQSKGVDEFCEWQSRMAWENARFHFKHNEFYRRKVGKILPKRWEDLPIIEKKDLQRPLDEILTKGIHRNDCHLGSTSGSSGIPFFYAKDKFAHAMTWALIANRYGWYDIDFNDKQGRFYGIPKEPVGYWKERLKDRAMNRVRFEVFDLSDNAFSAIVDSFRKSGLDYIYGYTSALVLFARYLLRNGITLKKICPSLRNCISTSELAMKEDHDILERAFGVKHIREYGVSETCLTAFDAPNNAWRLTEETLFTETVNDTHVLQSDGCEGNLLSTSLFNKAFPMIRYKVGDIGIIDERKDSIHRSVRKLIGRTNDNIMLPSGRIAAGLSFYYISRSILEASGVLKEFIVRQTTLNSFILDIVADRTLTDMEVTEIKEKVALYLEPGLDVSLNYVERIDRALSGKFKHFYSELNK